MAFKICLINLLLQRAGGKLKSVGRDVKGYVPEAPWIKHKRRKEELANMPSGSSREAGAAYWTQLSILFIRYECLEFPGENNPKPQKSFSLPDNRQGEL